jgi:nitroreductase
VSESFLQLASRRRSIRSFKSNKVDREILDRILEVCDMAPSSGGLQTFEIYQIINEKTKKGLVAAAHDQEFIAEAPLLLVFCANASRSSFKYGKRSDLFSVQDATIAAAYAQLTVYALGLTAVWVGAFDEKRVSEILGLPKEHRPVAMLPIGYPNEKPSDKIMRGPKDLLHVVK